MRAPTAVVVAFLVASLLSGRVTGASNRVPDSVLVLWKSASFGGLSIDPARAFEITTVWIVQQVYDTLVDFDREFSRAIPKVAESWTVSPDGRVYTFKLRNDARFHNGNTVGAKEVEFSIRRVFRLQLAPSFIVTTFIAKPEDVVAVGQDTVRVTFNQPMPEVLMASVLANPVTAIIDPSMVLKHATAGDPMAHDWLSANDAGSGPFILLNWNPELKIELRAFDGYWRGPPPMRRVLVQYVPDPAAQMAALARGEIDVAMDLLPGHYRQLERQPGISVKSVSSFSIFHLGMNVGYPPFSKKEVRNAIKWAIDYDAIKRVWEDGIDPGQTILPAGMFAHLPDRPYRRNLDRARTLLREAGFERGFKAELLARTDLPPFPAVASKIRQDLAQIGIEVEIKELRGREIRAIIGARTHQMALGRWTADYPDPDSLAKAYAHAGVRQIAWENQWDHDVKQMVEQPVLETDPRKREALYREIQKTTLEEGPYVILGYQLRQIAMRAAVKGLSPSPLGETYELFGVSKQ